MLTYTYEWYEVMIVRVYTFEHALQSMKNKQFQIMLNVFIRKINWVLLHDLLLAWTECSFYTVLYNSPAQAILMSTCTANNINDWLQSNHACSSVADRGKKEYLFAKICWESTALLLLFKVCMHKMKTFI